MIFFKTFAKSSLIHDQNSYYTRSDDLHAHKPTTASLWNSQFTKRNNKQAKSDKLT